jgi:phospholipase/lecithinase/hemolysin
MTSVTTRAVAFAKLWLFSFVVGIGLLAPGFASAAGPFDRIVVFGDSLSDSGNLYALGELLQRDPPGKANNNWSMNTDSELLTLVPDQAYISRHLSNGATWVEVLGSALGHGSNVRPSFGSTDANALNFAVAGATASTFGSLPPALNLGGQVGAFLARGDTTSDTLVVIAIGGNDIRAAAETPDAVNQIFAEAFASLGANIVALSGKAKKILIWNAPDLGRTPAFKRFAAFTCSEVPQPLQQSCITTILADVTALSVAFNSALEAVVLGPLETNLGIEFVRFDAFGLLQEVQENMASYGLTNATDACIQPSWPAVGLITAAPHRCSDPDQFFFWDGIHPTRAGHAIIADLVGKTLVEALQDH